MDQSFIEKRDSLALEVGLLTSEIETRSARVRELTGEENRLVSSIEDMKLKTSAIVLEESEKIGKIRAEHSSLQADIKSLKETKDLLSKDIEEKNTTIVNLGLMIKSVSGAISETEKKVKDLSTQVDVHTNKIAGSATKIEHESNRVKTFADTLSNVIDKERKINHEKTREIDSREIAVINRERAADLLYSKAAKGIK